jgi:hypothetical protein
VKGAKDANFKPIVGFLAVLALAISTYARLTLMFPGHLYLTVRPQAFNTHLLPLTMTCVSFVFEGWAAALPVVVVRIVVWWRVGRMEAIMIPAGGLITLVNTALKLVINRPHPSAGLVPILAPEQGNGFSREHVFFAIPLLGLTAYFISTSLNNRNLPKPLQLRFRKTVIYVRHLATALLVTNN